MHPRIRGKCPDLNLSTRLIPQPDRLLEEICEELTQGYRKDLESNNHAMIEDS
ncbi:MAG: hypothetical protein RLZZ444_2451 [Pseudomonadota bacterium]|jgi:hypothetical protein